MSNKIVVNYEELCLKKYLGKNDKLLFEKRFVSHDGYDCYGPKSYLYDYLVIVLRNNKLYYDIFHREKWFSSNEEYTPVNLKRLKVNNKYVFFHKEVPNILVEHLCIDEKNNNLIEKDNNLISSYNWHYMYYHLNN